nr:hypothetical protein [Solirubrobacterales bacterium]
MSAANPKRAQTDADSRSAPSGGRKGCCVLVIGEGDLTEETVNALRARGADVTCLREPDVDDVRKALESGDIDSVAVVSGEDPIVLR